LEILIHFFFSETEIYPGISASTDSSGNLTFTLLKGKITRSGLTSRWPVLERHCHRSETPGLPEKSVLTLYDLSNHL
jgi:hypothetical protein